jgi:hypothetical protein
MASPDSAEQRASRFADDTADAMARLDDIMRLLDMPVPGVRFAAARALNAEAGNRRKRQANLPTTSTKAVYDMLWRHEEQLYSRHGNSVFHTVAAAPATTGIMEQSVFARLAPTDYVVVVDSHSATGRSLLDGDIELPEPEVPEFGPDVWPITAVRVANARDVLAVRDWALLQRRASTSTADATATSEHG